METTLEVRPTVEKEPALGRAEGRAAERRNSKGQAPELESLTCV